MQVVFDTNVLINDEAACKEFVSQVTTELINSESDDPPFRLALDKEGRILQEYRRMQVLLRRRKKIDKSSPLFQLYHFIRRTPANGLIVKADSDLPDGETVFLTSNGCGNPIEPSLFGIAYKSQQANPQQITYVHLNGNNHLVVGVPRGYTGIYRLIVNRYLPMNDDARELLKTLLEDGPRPDNWATINRILRAIRIAGEPPLEGERHEFKGTDKEFDKGKSVRIDTGRLGQTVLDNLAKIVCSMLNKDGGYLFLGIGEKPDFAVTGFEWRHHGRTREEAQRSITDKLKGDFKDYPSSMVRIYDVLDIPTEIVPTNRMVLAIHIQRKHPEAKQYRANGSTGKKGKKAYYAHAVWVRSHSQVDLQQE